MTWSRCHMFQRGGYRNLSNSAGAAFGLRQGEGVVKCWMLDDGGFVAYPVTVYWWGNDGCWMMLDDVNSCNYIGN